MNSSRELHYFLLLTRDQQVQAIRRLRAMGMSDHTISTATRLSVEQVKAAAMLPDSHAAERAAPPHPAGEPTSGAQRSSCPRTGIPMQFCTCVGPHEGVS